MLRRRHFFQGRKIRGSEIKDLTWFKPNGGEMTDEDWKVPENLCFGLRLAGNAIDEVDEQGNQIKGNTLLILLNAWSEQVSFVLPGHDPEQLWKLVIDTREATGQRLLEQPPGQQPYELAARCFALFKLIKESASASK